MQTQSELKWNDQFLLAQDNALLAKSRDHSATSIHREQVLRASAIIETQVSTILSHYAENEPTQWLSELGFSSVDGRLLDASIANATSLKAIANLIQGCPQYKQLLVSWMNSPEYKLSRQTGHIIDIDDAKVALGFMGMENSWRVLLLLVYQKSLPTANKPFHQLARVYWELGLASALTAETVATHYALKTRLAFLGGLMPHFVYNLLVKQYFYLFERLRIQHIAKASSLAASHRSLLQCSPSPQAIIDMVATHQSALSRVLKIHLGSRLIPKEIFNPIVSMSPSQNQPSDLPSLITTSHDYAQRRLAKRYPDIVDSQPFEKHTVDLSQACLNELDSASLMRIPWIKNNVISSASG